LYIAFAHDHRVGGDGRYYHAIAALLADGKGFIAPEPYVNEGLVIPSAVHPPGWPLVLAGAALVGLRSTLELQLVACVIGTATVVMMGLAGRQLAGRLTGLVAAVIAAVYPNFWLYERELMSETLTLLAAATTVLLALRFAAVPSRGRAIALGVACGVLAITHAEQLLLVGVLLVPLVMLVPRVPRRVRVGWTAAAVAAAAAVILPWAAYNTVRFDEPVLIGTQLGVNVALSNCRFTYSGERLGFKDERCRDEAHRSGRITATDLPDRDRQYLAFGLDYARDHVSRAPIVLAAREGRLWGLIPQQARLDTGRGTRYEVIVLGFAAYWLLLPFAVAGVVVLRRRGARLLPLLALPLTVSIGTALTFGFTRLRVAADVSVVLLAAVAVAVLLRQVAARGSPVGAWRVLQPPVRSDQVAGGMFWLCRKRFVGSHFALRSWSRANFSGPNAAATLPCPSSPMKLR
jgi:4-amino-4-deoxy-L-arabinose transferase-like glycosyltransferase